MKSLTAVLVSALLVSSVNCQYYGKLISEGWDENAVHGISGAVYAVDESSFRIIGFTYDGNAPDAKFYLGTDKSYSQVSGEPSDDTAISIFGPNGKEENLAPFQDEDILLKLPEGRTLSEFTYISIWCELVGVYFGGVDIPLNFEAPKPQIIGQLTELAHDTSSGEITVLDDRTLSIKDFRYDGTGPDAYFYVGVSDNIEDQPEPYGIIPDENGSRGILLAYTGKDIILTLPSTLSFTSLKWISVWCRQANQNFGDIQFPANLNVPPALEVSIDRGQMNCEPLSDNLQVAWLVTGDYIMFELAGNIDRNTDYMAFGLSGSDSGISMGGSDVVVTDFTESGGARAVDYFITAYAQCSTNGGVCPDTKLSGGNGTNDVMEVDGQFTDGITRVSYKRKLQTEETGNDKIYKTDGPQQIVWSVGPLNTNNEAAKHYSDGRITAPKPINFGRETANNCPSFTTGTKVEKPDFLPHHLYGSNGRTVFEAEIGQSGSEQGYLALTDNPSWGIAWYINGTLIPELHLMRGTTYTFRVAGGDDIQNGAQYHPLYLTSSPDGGFSATQDANENIYQGQVNGENRDFATGVYCEWKLTEQSIAAAANGAVASCFEEYKMDLYLSCNEDQPYTEYTFTPDSDTPDLLYYQCYTHKNLGWKIHVYDEDNFPTEELVAEDCTTADNSAQAPAKGLALLMVTYVLSFLI